MKNPGRPTTVVEQLGKGIQVFLHRSTTEEMPRSLGNGNKQYAADVRSIFTRVFGSTKADLAEQDKVWDEWLRVEKREFHDLRGLLTQDVKDEFKARALTIMVLPGFRFAPFTWKDESSLDHYREEVVVANLSEKLRDFVIELIRVNVDAVRAIDFNEKLYGALFTYNDYTLQILAILPVDDPRAQALFDRYELNDPLGYSNMEDASGYNPFERIIKPNGYIINHDSKNVRADIPEHWKKLADQKMRAVITAEQTGKANPRYEWEDALKCYVRHIQPSKYSERLLPYRVELFASQMDFVLGLPGIASKDLFWRHKLPPILDAIAGDQYGELRHRLIRYSVIDNPESRFSVYDADDRKLADAILAEFGETDHELRDRVSQCIAEGEARQRENQQHKNAHQTKVDSILGKMK